MSIILVFMWVLTEALPLNKNNHIIFPEEFVPTCVNNKTFCEDVEIYPENTFYNVLKNSTYEQEYFESQSTIQEESISHRFHPERENYICVSRKRTLFPRVALNKKKVWKFVYNFDKYKQGVTTEECLSDTTCTSFHETPKGIRTKCVQKETDWLLLVADENAMPVWDLFAFPSACACSYEPVVNFNFI